MSWLVKCVKCLEIAEKLVTSLMHKLAQRKQFSKVICARQTCEMICSTNCIFLKECQTTHKEQWPFAKILLFDINCWGNKKCVMGTCFVNETPRRNKVNAVHFDVLKANALKMGSSSAKIWFHAKEKSKVRKFYPTLFHSNLPCCISNLWMLQKHEWPKENAFALLSKWFEICQTENLWSFKWIAKMRHMLECKNEPWTEIQMMSLECSQ